MEATAEMKQEVIIQDKVSILSEFNQFKQKIAGIRNQCEGLVIDGVNDKIGYARVDEARKICKKFKSEIEKTRKRIKAPVLQLSKDIDSEAHDASSEFAAIENAQIAKLAVIDEEKRIIAEKEAARIAEEERQAKIKIQQRVASLVQMGCTYNGISYVAGDHTIDQDDVHDLEKLDFDVFVEQAKAYFEAEAERLKMEQEEAARKQRKEEEARAEADRLAKIESDRIKAEQEAEMERMRLENEAAKAEAKRIQDEADAKLQAMQAELEASKAKEAKPVVVPQQQETVRRVAPVTVAPVSHSAPLQPKAPQHTEQDKLLMDVRQLIVHLQDLPPLNVQLITPKMLAFQAKYNNSLQAFNAKKIEELKNLIK